MKFDGLYGWIPDEKGCPSFLCCCTLRRGQGEGQEEVLPVKTARSFYSSSKLSLQEAFVNEIECIKKYKLHLWQFTPP